MWRRSAWGGLVGPLAFVGAWALGGVITSREYSPVHDTISRLAAVDAPTRWLMTSGMIVFGVALLVYAVPLRRAITGPSWITAGATGAATLGVAATPLDRSDLVDGLHLVAAGIGYVTLAAIPVLAFRPLLAAGRRGLAVFGATMAVVAVAALPISLVVAESGLFQRLGLTAGDLFLVASVPSVRSILAGTSSGP